MYCELNYFHPEELAALQDVLEIPDLMATAREEFYDAAPAAAPSPLETALPPLAGSGINGRGPARKVGNEGGRGQQPAPVNGKLASQTRVVRLSQHSFSAVEHVALKLQHLGAQASRVKNWGFEVVDSWEDLQYAEYDVGGVYSRHRDSLDGFTSVVGAAETVADDDDDVGGGGANGGDEGGGSGGDESAGNGAGKADTPVPDSSGEGNGKVDVSAETMATRVISVVVQLADGAVEYKGGDLQLLLGTLAEPKLARAGINAIRDNATVVTAPTCPGDVIMFLGDTVHQVTEVEEGTRKSIVWWLQGLKEDVGKASNRPGNQ